MKIGIYLTFDGECAEAFDFYKGIFGVDYTWKATIGETHMKDKVPAEMLDRIMHVSLPIGGDTVLMGCDYMKDMHVHPLVKGTNMQISLSPDYKQEADRLYKALSEGGSEDQPMKDMFWGSYHGSLTDKYGINWMIDCASDETSEMQIAAKEMRAIAKRVTETAENLEKLMPSNGEPAAKKKKM